ncbi:hypothetical protein [Sediminibacterium sp.]|uniref:hypothetical protein n=1 Tax=Sediminibacterium sp. TaxID=1917865 RepID=UPI0025F639C1|nr:hypothetical protein [Sediminibacterium sp.]MBT9485814.1 hypothetical protein [Sediminibacterium sp.]
MTSEPSPLEKEIARLHAEATRLKQSSWDAAIESLLAARALARAHGLERYAPFKEHLRLPLFLQSAGRWTESEREFKAIIAELTYVTGHRFGSIDTSQSYAFSQSDRHACLSSAYEKYALAAKRERLPELAAWLRSFAVSHDAQHRHFLEASLREFEAADRERKARVAARRASRT